MKNLVTTVGTATAGGGYSTVASFLVPATTWFPGKIIIVRLALDTIVAGFGGGVVANIQEQFLITNGNTWAVPNPGSMTFTVGNGSTWREFRFLRQDPNITGVDYNQAMSHGPINTYNGTSYANTITPAGAAFDYSSQIRVEYQVSIPGSLGASTVSSAFAQGLIEQGTNLGKLY